MAGSSGNGANHTGPDYVVITDDYAVADQLLKIIDGASVKTFLAGGFLRVLLRLLRRGRLLDTSHGIRPPLTKAFGIKLPNEFPQRQLPWLLVMVVQLPELLWVHPQLTCHLHVLMRQVELASCIDPGLQVCRYPWLLLRHRYLRAY